MLAAQSYIEPPPTEVVLLFELGGNEVSIIFLWIASYLAMTVTWVSSLRACEAIQKKQHAKVAFYSGVYILVIRPFSISSKVGLSKMWLLRKIHYGIGL